MSLTELDFTRAAWLLALAPAALLLWGLWRALREKSGPWAKLVDASLLPHLLVATPKGHRRLALLLVAIGLLGAIVALSGPTRRAPAALADRGDAARVLVVDLSPAMNAGDATPTPMERARLKLLALLAALPAGQTALVAYAEEPYLVAPLTTDAATVALLVPELAPGIVPLAGDRPERALQMARAILARSGAAQRDVIWITAASRPSPATRDAIVALRAEEVKLSVLAARHAPDPALPPLAEAGGGLYVALGADDEDMRRLAATLFGESAASATRMPVRTGYELGPWLVALLLPLAALAFRRGVLFALVLPLLIVSSPSEAFDSAGLWSRPDREGLRRLESGDAAGAAKHFSDPRWQAVAHYRAGRFAEAAALFARFDDPDSHYNRGNALARLGRVDEALDAFERALRLRPGDDDAEHNRDLVRSLRDREKNPEQTDPEPGRGGEPPPSTGSGSSEQRNATQAPPGAAPAETPRRPRADAGTEDAGPAHVPASNRPDVNSSASAPASRGAAAPPRPAHPTQPGEENPPPSRSGQSDPGREADLLADQLLRRVPDEPAGLLQRKLMLEHRRRESGEAPRPWR